MEIRRLDNKYTNILAGYTKEKFLSSRCTIDQPGGGGGGDGKLHTAKLQVENEAEGADDHVFRSLEAPSEAKAREEAAKQACIFLKLVDEEPSSALSTPYLSVDLDEGAHLKQEIPGFEGVQRLSEYSVNKIMGLSSNYKQLINLYLQRAGCTKSFAKCLTPKDGGATLIDLGPLGLSQRALLAAPADRAAAHRGHEGLARRAWLELLGLPPLPAAEGPPAAAAAAAGREAAAAAAAGGPSAAAALDPSAVSLRGVRNYRGLLNQALQQLPGAGGAASKTLYSYAALPGGGLRCALDLAPRGLLGLKTFTNEAPPGPGAARAVLQEEVARQACLALGLPELTPPTEGEGEAGGSPAGRAAAAAAAAAAAGGGGFVPRGAADFRTVVNLYFMHKMRRPCGADRYIFTTEDSPAAVVCTLDLGPEMGSYSVREAVPPPGSPGGGTAAAAAAAPPPPPPLTKARRRVLMERAAAKAAAALGLPAPPAAAAAPTSPPAAAAAPATPPAAAEGARLAGPQRAAAHHAGAEKEAALRRRLAACRASPGGGEGECPESERQYRCSVKLSTSVVNNNTQVTQEAFTSFDNEDVTAQKAFSSSADEDTVHHTIVGDACLSPKDARISVIEKIIDSVFHIEENPEGEGERKDLPPPTGSTTRGEAGDNNDNLLLMPFYEKMESLDFGRSGGSEEEEEILFKATKNTTSCS